jgi:hypothetical protein
MTTDDFGIWPPHEAFYIEALLFCTTAALRAADSVHDALEASSALDQQSAEWQECARVIVDGAQTVALHAAAISRYLWPAKQKEPHLSRGAVLRKGFAITNDSPLKSRDLRNALEHFDERLDSFCRTLGGGYILPTYVGSLGNPTEAPVYMPRAYYTDIGIFEVLGERFAMSPILDAVDDLH